MSNAVAEHVSRIRLSDPLPTGCSACLCAPGPGIRFVDFQAAFDAGAIVGPSEEVRRSLDELHLCESCVRSAGEVLSFRPQLHAAQAQVINGQDTQIEHWREECRQKDGEIARLNGYIRRLEAYGMRAQPTGR